MTASAHANEIANAIQGGIDCLFHLRALRADPPLASATELEEWGEFFDRTLSTFAEIQAEIQAGKAQTSLRLTSDLVRSFADVRAHLSAVVPGVRLPATLFDLVEIAWSELAKAVNKH